MINLLTIILGYIIGITILQTVIDILFFDIPFTIKNRKSPAINYKNILSSSITSLILFFFILIGLSYLIYSIGGSVILFIIDMFLACFIKGNFSSQKKISFYCNKYRNSINSYITFGIIKSKENNNYIENYKEILELFNTYNKF